ncbi:MAG: thioredoxin [Lachnospiraceae bacterium]|nr:thioredoxin [Lachnospiraceae bacterium]
MEYKFTKENFESEVMSSDVPVLVDFYADWCGPCKMMSPVVDNIAEKYTGRAKVGKVNVDEQQEIAGKFGIMSIPSFIFIKDGKKVDQAMGAMPASALESKLEQIL